MVMLISSGLLSYHFLSVVSSREISMVMFSMALQFQVASVGICKRELHLLIHGVLI